MLASLLTGSFVAGQPARKRYILPDGEVTTNLEMVRLALIQNIEKTERKPTRTERKPKGFTHEKNVVSLQDVPKMGLKTIDKFIEEAEAVISSDDSVALLAILLALD